MFSILVHAAQPSAHVPHPSRNSCPKLHSSGDCGHSSRRSARSPQPEVLTPEVLAWQEDLTGAEVLTLSHRSSHSQRSSDMA